MLLLKNNAYSSLAAAINDTDTTLSVQVGTGDRFPVVAAPDTALVTLQDASNNIEIVRVTERTAGADSMTIQRAQDGTAARAWSIGDVAEIRLPAAAVAPLQVMDSASTASGIRTKLGATATGSAVFTAADDAAARAAIGATATGQAVMTAADAPAARAAIGALGATDTILNATNAVNASNTTTQAQKTAGPSIASTEFADKFRSLHPSTTAGTLVLSDRGCIVKLAAGITVPADVFGENDVVSLYNNTAGNLTITQGAGLTLRFAGTANTGNRTLSQRGLSTVIFVSANEAVISGAGIS